MNILYRNESKLKLFSFMYNNQSLSYTLFNFLVSKFNEQESLLLENDEPFDELNYEFKISEIDFYYIYDKSLEVKQELFSRKNIIYSNSLKRNFNEFQENIEYLIQKKEKNTIILNNYILKEIIRDNLEDLTLENPFYRTESLKHKMLNLINKKIDGNYFQPIYEQYFFKLIKDSFNSFEHIYYKNISKKNKINIKNFIEKNYNKINIEDYEILNFLNKMFEIIEEIIYDITIITDSLKNRVNNILKIVEKTEKTSTKKKIINKYLSTAMKTLTQFYAKDKPDTIQMYMIYLFNILDICIYYIELKNIDNNFIIQIMNTRTKYINCLDKLKNNINVLTKKIKEKEEYLIFEEKLTYYFSIAKESIYDSTNKKEEKQKKINILLQKNINEYSIINKSNNAFVTSFKNSDLKELLFKYLQNKYDINKNNISEEEKEEESLYLKEKENKYINLIEKQEQEKLNKKEIVLKLTDFLDLNIDLINDNSFEKKVNDLFKISEEKWLSKEYSKEFEKLLIEFNTNFDKIETLQSLSKIIERKIK